MISLVDAHCDTITKICLQNEELFDNTCHLSIKHLSLFDSPVQFFSIFLEEKYLDSPFFNTLKFIDFFHEQVYKYNKYIDTVSTYDDILENKINKKISAVLTLEGGEALEGRLSNVETFYELGIRSIILTWNNNNHLGDGVGVLNGSGLTRFGHQVVRKMNELNMLVDVSHLNEEGFWDVFNTCKAPFIASHSNSYAVCPHKRNLNDEQLKAIKSAGGIVGINLYAPFLKINGNATTDDIIKHIDYLINLIGENHIGLGCDFDGIESCVLDINNVSDIIKIYYQLKKYYGIEIAEKIFSGNFLNFLSDFF